MITVAVDLNYAVGGFTLLFHALRRWSDWEINDLSSAESGHAKMEDAPTLEDLTAEAVRPRLVAVVDSTVALTDPCRCCRLHDRANLFLAGIRPG